MRRCDLAFIAQLAQAAKGRTAVLPFVFRKNGVLVRASLVLAAVAAYLGAHQVRF
jgi:glycerol-3-phosphate acyltransferase PlsY